MSPFVLTETPTSYPSHHDGEISGRVIYETRQRELASLFLLTGEVMINEYCINYADGKDAL